MDADTKRVSRAGARLFKAALSCGAATLSAAMIPPALAQSNVSEDEIVVTANRTETALSRTPVAVTALSGDDLLSSGITNPTQIQDRAPGISIDRASSSGLQITIRGVSSADNTEKGDPSASFLLDGIYLARPQAQDVSFFDVSRVEVLRGPQGTLYGRNATAGVVNVITALPTHEFEGSFNAAYGDYDTRQATAVLNVPVTDTFALRAAVNYDYRDTYLNRPGPIDGSPDRDNLSGRLTALFNIRPNLELVVRGDYSAIRGAGAEILPLANLYATPLIPPAPGQAGVNPTYLNPSAEAARTVSYALPTIPDADNSTWGLSAELGWDISDRFKLTYLGAHREFDRDELTNTEFFSGLRADVTFDGAYWQDSHEARLAYEGEQLRAQAGLYYFHEESDIETNLFGLLNPTPGADGYVYGFVQSPTIAESVALFGQGTFDVTDRFRMTAGVRYTQDDKSRLGVVLVHATTDDPVDFTSGPDNPIADRRNDAAVRYEQTTWRIGSEFDVSPTTLLYTSVSTGYKAGGFNDGCGAGAPDCFSAQPESALYYDPETLTAYEIGLKTRLLGDTLRLFANYFHYNYRDLQLTSANLVTNTQQTNNAGRAEIDGVEIEALIRPSEHDQVNLAFTWTDAAYTDYQIVPGVNLAGLPLDRAPELVLNVGYDHTFPLQNGANLVFGVNSKLSSEYFILSPGLRAQFRQPDYTRTDVSATYHAAGGAWYVQAFGKNLEDSVQVSYANDLPAFATLAPPRTYGIRVGVDF